MRFEDLAVGPPPQLPLDAFRQRREKVAEALGEGVLLVVATNPQQMRSRDVEWPFRPHSDFWYLTGFAEPGCVLALEGGTGRTTLFLRGRQPEAEVWTGRRLGVERAAEALGVDRARDAAEMPQGLGALCAGSAVHAVADHHSAVAEAVRNAVGQDGPLDARPLLAGFRCIKDAGEQNVMRKAAEVGMAAMRQALAVCRPGRHEYEVEAELLRSYRAAGSTGAGYPPIVGAGANAAILHYVDNRARIAAGDLVLVDAGCEWGYYNSDITRTVPAGGEWTGAQKELYALVRTAQVAALGEVRPGGHFKAPHEAAVRVLVDGLVDMGWLAGDKEKLIADEAHRRFYMHGTSHFLGLDVHDVGAVKDADGQPVPLRPGMVLTVEPGLYANPDYTRLPQGVAPFGIRIEDDVLVTEDGHESLTAALSADPDDAAGLVA